MGFHKRWLDEEQICKRYQREGMQAVLDWINSADAIISTDQFSMALTELLDSEGDKIEIWNRASEMISDRALEIDHKS